MGNSQSNPAKNKTRRSNRLSKPLTKNVALSSPQLSHPEIGRPELATGLIGWQNPWVGSQISTDIRSSYPKARDIPPTLFESEPDPPEQDATENLAPAQSPIDHNIELIPRHSGSLSASPSIRRASYQPGSFGDYSLASQVPEQPRRANSIQTPLRRHRSVIYEDTVEDATSSNTHFLVGNQRFSLTRRRSLLTRPGVATRRTTGAIRRVPSPIGEPEEPVDDPTEVRSLQWPLPSRQRPPLSIPPPMRPTSPPDARYTQLGALKLGSLRVVNGAASPCPSERIPLSRPRTTGPGLGLENAETIASRSTLEIPSVAEVKKSDDDPGSPFSFEKSPVITVPPRTKTMFPGDSEDEGIGMCDEVNGQLEKSAMDVGFDRSTSRSLNKSDSGYSSAASVRSFQRSRTRASLDSQTSGSCTAESSRNTWVTSDQACVSSGQKVQRHLSLQEANPKNYSRLHPASVRWYDCSDPATEPLAGLRARRSTLCIPQYHSQGDLVSDTIESVPVESPYAFASREEQSVSTRGPLYGDRFSTNTLALTPSSGSSTTPVTPYGYHQNVSTDSSGRVHRSASENRSFRNHEALIYRSRSRSQRGSRIWCQKPGIEVPPLPTILSPDHLHAGAEDAVEFPLSETRRGRPRSRSQDCRRRRLTKARPQSELFI